MMKEQLIQVKDLKYQREKLEAESDIVILQRAASREAVLASA